VSYRADTLDCQECGEILKHLTPAEAQQVADNPYNFIVYCKPCQKDMTVEGEK
jgi:hypothetical protein